MRVALAGTPGTGKSTVADMLSTDLDVVHLNERIREAGLHEGADERGSLVADLDAVADDLAGRDDLLVESHLAHLLSVDRVVVLRCAPSELERRLLDRGEPATTARENAESEALDLVLSEAVERHGADRVYEVDTTGREPAAVASDVEAAVAGERDPSAGEVDFVGYLTAGGADDPAERPHAGDEDDDPAERTDSRDEDGGPTGRPDAGDADGGPAEGERP